jgi:molecular chaperone GrpE (heat shock protein)
MTGADEFATAMQQLGAEAEKVLSAGDDADAIADKTALSQLAEDVGALNSRLDNLERVVPSKIDDLATGNGNAIDPALADHLQFIQGQLAELMNREGSRQKLFDSLHAELLSYRDNLIRESLQRPFIHDLVLLFDDLTELAKQLENTAEEPKGRGHVARWCDNLRNAIHSLLEILHRFEVKEVETKETFDRAIHRAVCFEPTDCEQEDGQVMARVRRGFIWRDKLIRPEEVIVKKFG